MKDVLFFAENSATAEPSLWQLLKICPLDFTVRLGHTLGQETVPPAIFLPILPHTQAHMDEITLILLWKSKLHLAVPYRSARQRRCDCEVPGDCHKAGWENPHLGYFR